MVVGWGRLEEARGGSGVGQARKKAGVVVGWGSLEEG